MAKSKLANELHAISAVAKARASWFSVETAGSIRHLLGGHGYSSYSRLGRIYFDQDVNTTWEGDNNMLLQQTTKYVLKEMQKIKEKPDPSSLLNFANQVLLFLIRTSLYHKNGQKKTFSLFQTISKSISNAFSKPTMN